MGVFYIEMQLHMIQFNFCLNFRHTTDTNENVKITRFGACAVKIVASWSSVNYIIPKVMIVYNTGVAAICDSSRKKTMIS